jgi:hypothetical protein
LTRTDAQRLHAGTVPAFLFSPPRRDAGRWTPVPCVNKSQEIENYRKRMKAPAELRR